MTTLLFDLDGTLIDSLPDIAAAANHVRTSLGRERLPLDVIARFVGNGMRWLLERCFEGESIDLDRAGETFVSYYAEHPAVHTVLYDGVLDLLDALKPQRLAILSNKPEPLCHRVLEALGIADRFVRVAGGETYPTRKPHKEPVLALLSEVDARPEDSIMIGDGHQDVRAGKAAGLRTVAVTWGFHPRATLEKEEPDWIVDDVRALGDLLLHIDRT